MYSLLSKAKTKYLTAYCLMANFLLIQNICRESLRYEL